MRAALRVLRHGLRLLPLVVVLALVVPGSGVRPTTIGLMKVQPAEAYDFADGVVWTLVLGEDAEGQTDLIQLLGINFRNGDAAAIGIPRDSWFELSAEEGEARINTAYAAGGAELAAGAVERLVGIAPDYVLVTDTDGFLAMVGTLGEVEVDSEFAFQAEDSDLQVHRGVNTFSAQEALDFAVTRTLTRGDFDRSLNHQALLLGLLEALRDRDDEPGFIEALGLDAVDGIDTGNLSPLDLYRLLNALTSVDPGSASGCIVLGSYATSPLGGDIVLPDFELARRYGDDVRSDAHFDRDCPEASSSMACCAAPGTHAGCVVVDRRCWRIAFAPPPCHRTHRMPLATAETWETRPRSPRRTRSRPRGPARSPGRGARRAAWRRRCWRGCAPS